MISSSLHRGAKLRLHPAGADPNRPFPPGCKNHLSDGLIVDGLEVDVLCYCSSVSVLPRNILIALLLIPFAVLALADWYGRLQATEAARRRYPGCEDGDQFKLRDGRRLGYRRIGNPFGKPVFFFHGALGSRLEWPVSDESVHAAGLYVVAVERPGYGCSDPQADRTLHKWVEDVEQLASFLRWRRFRVIGWSGGAVHALAVAKWMPGRVESLDLIGSLGPAETSAVGRRPAQRLIAAAAAWLPGLTWRVASRYREEALTRRDDIQSKLLSSLSPAEEAELRQPEAGRHVHATHQEAMRHSIVGLLEDLRVLARDWGFSPQSVDTPVRVWHGTADSLAPLANGRALAAALPNAEFIECRDEGHFLLYWHEADILRGQGLRDVPLCVGLSNGGNSTIESQNYLIPATTEEYQPGLR
jgi:pimeloyl-ACP methyl ester carboxylesterase